MKHDSEHDIVAFTVTNQFYGKNEFEGMPVVKFEEVAVVYPPSEYKMFAPLMPNKINKIREKIYFEIKNKSYEMISYISSKATIFGNEIGENCFILEDNTIQPYTKIGKNVVLWSGNHIGHHGVIKDHVFFTSHVVLSGHCVVEPYCFLGVNSTIRDGVHLAEGTLVGMGAVIEKDTEAYGIYKGPTAAIKKVKGNKLEKF